MFISLGTCDWKCCKELGLESSICQNSELAKAEEIEVSLEAIRREYLENPITQAIVVGGLEPFTYFMELLDLVDEFRRYTSDDIVIYTGYYPYEIINELIYLSKYDNIILKFGRYIPGDEKHLDKILGVELVSDNQYAVRLIKDSQDALKSLKENNGYCPNIIIKNENTKCCCFKFLNQDVGKCYCGIFSK